MFTMPGAHERDDVSGVVVVGLFDPGRRPEGRCGRGAEGLRPLPPLRREHLLEPLVSQPSGLASMTASYRSMEKIRIAVDADANRAQ
jgi:hypothetical protein